MEYPFDLTSLGGTGVVSMPEPRFWRERTALREAQQQIIDAQPNTYLGASTAQYGLEFYPYVSGSGSITPNAVAARSIANDLAILTKQIFGEFPLVSLIDGAVDDYWFVGDLWPDPLLESSPPVNYPTLKFFTRFFDLLKQFDYEYVNSVAYEILEFFHPPEWSQRNYAGNVGISGWVPPSAFIQPTNQDALNFMSRVQVTLLELAVDAGIAPRFQIGEPWWWDGSYSVGAEKNAPCLYDYKTLAMYRAETGNDVPTPFIKNIFDSVAEDQWPYIAWLQAKLGDSTNYIRDRVKITYPEAKATLLFFTPQILSPSSELTRNLNFPIDQWKFPNYDFVQIEDYDWIIDGRLDLVPLTFNAALEILNYPLESIHYFIGFVLLAQDKHIWGTADKAWALAKAKGVQQNYLWSYTQVMRDNVLIKKRKSY